MLISHFYFYFVAHLQTSFLAKRADHVNKDCIDSIVLLYVKRCFVNFLVIFGDVWKEIVFLKGLVKFGEIRNIKDLM